MGCSWQNRMRLVLEGRKMDDYRVILILASLITALTIVVYYEEISRRISETKRQDKVYAESSVEQKLDMIYQQNKELKQMLEECRIWILAK